ncbi:MAG: FHA domain-containing protein [Anaerolineaceae bacterium]
MKKPSTHRFLYLLLITGFLFTFISTPTFAQGGLRAILSQPDLSQFPSLTTYVDVYDSQNNFVSDLAADQFTLQENGAERTINEATRVEPGLHTILALNLGPTLSNKVNEDTTRYEDIIFILTSWLDNLQSQASNLYSFTSNERAIIQHSSDPQELLQALQTYQPNLYNFEADQTSLTYAIDVASQEPQLANHAKQAILYITPLPIDSELDQIPILAARAADIGIPVYVWLVANETSSNSQAADALRDLAETTGGQFFLYNEKVEAPNPETYLSALRYTYRLRYTSAINQSGFHRIKVTVERGVQQAETEDVAFQIELLAPVVTIIALPPQIQLVWVENEEGDTVLKPDFITLQISVTFPDGYPRQLKYSRLVVDGQEVIKLDQQPFEWLGWPLGGFRVTAVHNIQVEVEDILGFSSKSSAREVEIIVDQRYTGFWGGFTNFLNSGGWILFAALLAFGGMVAYLNQRRRNPRLATAGVEPALTFDEDPLTQQIFTPAESSRAAAVESIYEPLQLIPQLVPLSGDSSKEPLKGSAIHLTAVDTTIGSDPTQANLLLDDPSISPLHARIRRSSQGTLILADLGSERGTLVNYAPVSKKGTVLQNNDLIHFGEVAYRYELVPVRVRKSKAA